MSSPLVDWRANLLDFREGNEIHVWFADDTEFSEESQLNNFSELLSSEESDRRERFYFDKDSHQFLISRAMLRNCLSLYDDTISPEDWRFEFNEFGKPRIVTDQCRGSLYFNLSHTTNLIALVIYRFPEIGIDVETRMDRRRYETLVKHALTPAEYDRCIELDENARCSRLLSLWTLKESYVKALGKGLSICFTSFGFDLDSLNEPILQDPTGRPVKGHNWKFINYNIGDSHAMAIAWQNRINVGREVRVKSLNFTYRPT